MVARVTMPARLTLERLGAEMASPDGEVSARSDVVAARDASLPVAGQPEALGSEVLSHTGSRRATARPWVPTPRGS